MKNIFPAEKQKQMTLDFKENSEHSRILINTCSEFLTVLFSAAGREQQTNSVVCKFLRSCALTNSKFLESDLSAEHVVFLNKDKTYFCLIKILLDIFFQKVNKKDSLEEF